jgi:hypothetical protein
MPELTASADKFDPRAWITPDDLNVAPSLLGLPLATPRQRLFAMAADLSLLALANHLGNFWLLMAAGLALYLWLRQHRPELFGARQRSRRPRLFAWGLVLVMTVGGLLQAWNGASRSVEDEPEVAAAAASAQAKSEAQALQIERLEAQLERARAPAFHALRSEFNYWLDKIGLSYFWAAVYFTLLPLVWVGQTPGKCLLGLRVVELTGKRLTPLILFKRYGGYAAGLFTGMTGFAQLIWDSNRQAIQDKTAHTVVIDARSGARLAAVPISNEAGLRLSPELPISDQD